MAATIVALAVAWVTTRRLAMVPLVSAVFVGLFGALTLWLQDEIFIKVKVTLVNALFGTILLVGLCVRQAVPQDAHGRDADHGRRGLAQADVALGACSSSPSPASTKSCGAR